MLLVICIVSLIPCVQASKGATPEALEKILEEHREEQEATKRSFMAQIEKLKAVLLSRRHRDSM